LGFISLPPFNIHPKADLGLISESPPLASTHFPSARLFSDHQGQE
jgi:hypothetical protein